MATKQSGTGLLRRQQNYGPPRNDGRMARAIKYHDQFFYVSNQRFSSLIEFGFEVAEKAADKWNVIYVSKWKQWMVYEGGIYVEYDEERIRFAVRKLLKRYKLKQSPFRLSPDTLKGELPTCCGGAPEAPRRSPLGFRVRCNYFF